MKSLLSLVENRFICGNEIGDESENIAGKSILAFLPDILCHSTLPDRSLPVKLSHSEWAVLDSPERIRRIFEFPNYDTMKYFLDNLMSFQEKISHHAEIVISHRMITVTTYTHDINAVTEQDKKLSTFADELFTDIEYIRRNIDEY